MSQNGNLPQIGVKIKKYLSCHHPVNVRCADRNLEVAPNRSITPPKFNMEPENHPLEKEKTSSKSSFFGFHVSFRGRILQDVFTTQNPSRKKPTLPSVRSKSPVLWEDLEGLLGSW